MKKILFSILFLFLLASPCYGSGLFKDPAQTLDQSVKFSEATDLNTGIGFTQIISTVIQVFLSLLGIIFVILLVYGGYLWMNARGNEEQVKKAKDTIRMAIIGLVIVTSAYAITYFVFNALPDGGGGSGDVTPS